MQTIHIFYKCFSEGRMSLLFLSAMLQMASSKLQNLEACLFTIILPPAELFLLQNHDSFPAHKLEGDRKDIPFDSQLHKTAEG